jgi:glycosyltransferase involved in cell wall biosynthesis
LAEQGLHSDFAVAAQKLNGRAVKILHIHSGNIFGGVERILIALASHKSVSKDFEHEFALCFQGRLATELTIAGARVYLLPSVRLGNPFEVLRTRRELQALFKRENFDLAIVHSAWSHIVFGPVVKAGEVPLIFWLHTRAAGDRLLERCAQLYFPDAILSVSKWVDESAAELFPGIFSRVVYSPLALDEDAFARAHREATRKGLGARPDAVVILQASRMELWKGHRELLQALGKLRSNERWTCWIAGGAERPEEENYFQELQTMTRELQLGDRVKFLGRRSDVPALLMAADIYCQANTEAEGFSIAFVEAFFAGLPIVTSALGGALEIVDADCGLLARGGDVEGLAGALSKLIGDEALRRKLGAAGRERALERCDPVRQFRELEKFLDDVVRTHV